MLRLLRYFLCWLLLGFPFNGKAQIADVSAGPVADGDVIFINKHTAYLKFSSSVSFDSARKAFSRSKENFLPGRNIIFKGYDPHYYWYRFIVQNKGTEARDFILMQSGLGIRDSELWQTGAGRQLLNGKTGYRYSFEERPYRNVHHCIPVKIQPGAMDTFFLGVNDSHAFKVQGFVLIEPHVLKKKESTFYFLFGIMIGLLLLFIFINLYLFIAIREKIHLWYSAYLVSTLLFLVKNEGLDAEFLGLDSETGYRLTSMGAISAFAVGFMMQVAQLFLKNINRKSFLYRLMTFVKWSAFLSGFAFWLVFYLQPATWIEVITYQWGNKTIFVSLIIVPAACIYSFAKGYKPALFILIGMALFLVGSITRTLFLLQDSYLFPPSAFEVGMVLEAIIISFALMYRYNEYKKEKDKLQKELELQQKDAVIQVMQAQEAEQKRIAADLHDELGGNLAAIKMGLQRFNLPESQASELTALIDRASVNARNISHNLMPPEFADTSLKELLENYFRRLNKESPVRFYFHHTGSNHHFDKQEELMIYRILMELTNNILRHSKATESTMQFIYQEDHLAMVVEDNGTGIFTDQKNGMGLKNVKSRLNYLNGTMEIDSGEKGTTIMINIPYKERHA
jgi:signal transduction histidine kinase